MLVPTETQSQILEDYVQSLRQKTGVESILWMYLRNVTLAEQCDLSDCDYDQSENVTGSYIIHLACRSRDT